MKNYGIGHAKPDHLAGLDGDGLNEVLEDITPVVEVEVGDVASVQHQGVVDQ